MIDLWLCNSKVFVWNVEDAFLLRKQHHIVGSLVGCHPTKPFQGQNKGLPLQLMNEEVKILLDKGIAQLRQSTGKNDKECMGKFYERREKLCEEQMLLLKEARKQQILEKADAIYEGKKRKHMEMLEKRRKTLKKNKVGGSKETASEIVSDATGHNSNSYNENNELGASLESEVVGDAMPDKDAVIEAELAKVTDVDKGFCRVQQFYEYPWKKDAGTASFSFPTTEAEKVRYEVFKDLWENNYYVTPGTKFGGDFLAYEGDPLVFHALYIIVCLCKNDKIPAKDIAVYGRLGQQVKKTAALATLGSGGKVEYITISWEHEST